MPATGNTAEWMGAIFFRLECGTIAEVWTASDNPGQFMNLGVITLEELANPVAAGTPTP